MAIATYDPALCILVFGEVTLGGFMEGTFITIERDEDAYQKVAGADGTPARVRNRNRLGSITAILQQSSPSNDLLSAIAATDDPELPGLPGQGRGNRPITFRELNGTSSARATDAWIRKMPKMDRAKEFMGVEWIFDCGVLRQFVGGLVTL